MECSNRNGPLGGLKRDVVYGLRTDSRNIESSSVGQSAILEPAKILQTPSRPHVGGGRRERGEKIPPCTRARRKFIGVRRSVFRIFYFYTVPWQHGDSMKFAQTKQRLIRIICFFSFGCFQTSSRPLRSFPSFPSH